ncbi:hypothetical protein [Streptomyces sp. UG1]|uniref:hypothetical protein n=1 Tax=Streptomyces sp. UG1 TaxID=3417652 RepID=UPI003CE8B101
MADLSMPACTGNTTIPAAEPSDLAVAISVAQQLIDSDQVLSLREPLRLLLRALDAEPTNTPPKSVPEPVRDLLTAISEVLTLPNPGGDRMDMVRYESCVSERIHLVQLAIRDTIAGKAKNGLEWEAAYLRQQIERRPPRYRTSEQEIADLRRIASGGEGQ